MELDFHFVIFRLSIFVPRFASRGPKTSTKNGQNPLIVAPRLVNSPRSRIIYDVCYFVFGELKN